MNFRYIKNIAPVAAIALSMGMSSCVNDLDVTPIDPSSVMTVDEVALYTKCYANMSLQGQNGAGDNDCDIDGYDGGTVGFVRQLFNSNELTTDEAICGWGDTGIPAFNYNTWDPSHPMMEGFYYRLYSGIDYCNHYLEVCSGENAQRTAEVRFLRALYYSYLMDTYGNVPFATEISAESPSQIKRADLFAWIESEVKDCMGSLAAPTKRKSSDNGYGTADQDAANLLLARLYLNAEVYTGTSHWAEAKEYAEKIINGGAHPLCTTSATDSKGKQWSAYQKLFMGDNGETDAAYEAILPILQDGTTTTSWCTSLFVMASTWQSDMDKDGDYGTSEFWAGNRSRSNLVKKFFPNGDAPQLCIEDMTKAAGDDRALFFGENRTLTATTPTEFKSGYSVGKFRNTYSTGATPHHTKYVDTDFFLMRSAEAYLIAAEADARINGGQATATGVKYINALRARANATEKSTYNLDQILDERSRELYFEGFRRTDLIRYGYFGGDKSSSYLWEWKGGAENGVGFGEFRNVFALPSADINANPKLTQNPGY